MPKIVILFSILSFSISVKSARILAFFPTPSVSHQVVFQPIVQELVNRGHEVVFITPNPIFPKEEAPANLTEIDLHDISYRPWNEFLSEDMEDMVITDQAMDKNKQHEMMTILLTNLLEVQLSFEPVKKLVQDKSQHFDLILIEAYIRATLVLSHLYKNTPVILVSSFGPIPFNIKTVGALEQPILYPSSFVRKINNLTFWEKILQFYENLEFERTVRKFDLFEHEKMKRIAGSDVPSIDELANNVDMLFVNIHPLWDFNRPVPPNVIYMGAMHLKPVKSLPEDLKKFLDSSKNGVIYMSFGTNVDPLMFPPQLSQVFARVFESLPYDVLWKWHTNDIPGLANNTKVSKWYPQRDLLKHPKVKLFITQGGLQSTDEAIDAEVPMIGIPMLGDQWYNVELYVYHQIGMRLDVASINEEVFKEAITTVIGNEKYRRNIKKLREIMCDQPQSPLQRAVWWVEHVLRHGGAGHLRAPSANMRWTEYYEVEIFYILIGSLSLILFSIVFVYIILRLLGFGASRSTSKSKSKIN